VCFVCLCVCAFLRLCVCVKCVFLLVWCVFECCTVLFVFAFVRLCSRVCSSDGSVCVCFVYVYLIEFPFGVVVRVNTNDSHTQDTHTHAHTTPTHKHTHEQRKRFAHHNLTRMGEWPRCITTVRCSVRDYNTMSQYVVQQHAPIHNTQL